MTPGPGIFRTQLPRGFYANGINCGVRKYRPDLGIIISDVPSTAVGVFTQSTCRAAPVLYCEKLLPSNTVRAIITNSGQANAATGLQGERDNQQMVEAVAKALECSPQAILSASTGVIGEPLKMELITKAIPELVHQVTDVAESFALAILTTDLVPKTIMTKVKLSGGEVTITGICKGSGMIHPNMATMLGYLLTDLKMAPDVANTMLKDVVDDSFNMISVDGDTSTNDCVFLLANGESGVALDNESDQKIFKQALKDVSIVLAKSIARDGEGATKLIEAIITGAPDVKMARQVARTLIGGLLIKTAVHGESPNWGRVLAHLGAIQIPATILEKVRIKFQNQLVFAQNEGQAFDRDRLKRDLKKDTVFIEVDLKSGNYSARAWGCDLSKKYVEINAEYVT